MTATLTAKRLREVLRYEPQTGLFVWKSRPANRVQVGSIAGHMGPDGYRLIGICGRVYKASRLAFLYMTGEMPEVVDHRNRDRGDDRWANLRPATLSQNGFNKGRQRNNTSGFKGVTHHQGKWRVQISCEGRLIRKSGFDTAAAAALAYDKLAAEVHGSFTCSNGG